MAKVHRRFKCTTKQNPQSQVAPNLLTRPFSAHAPHKVWIADITYVRTQEGWLYVAVALDLFSRQVVGLAIGDRITAELSIIALRQAVIHQRPKLGLIHHSDRGSQYTNGSFQKQLKAYGITPIMSGTGHCYDNSPSAK